MLCIHPSLFKGRFLATELFLFTLILQILGKLSINILNVAIELYELFETSHAIYFSIDLQKIMKKRENACPESQTNTKKVSSFLYIPPSSTLLQF